MAAIDFYCSEHTLPQTSSCTTTTEDASLHCRRREHAMSTKLDLDDRRLAVLMEQEQRFMPNAYHLRKVVNERERALLLETILQIEAICPEPRKSDCYHLIVNLLDRFLGYREPKIEELPMIVTACAMISLKLRRATQECLSYQQLRYYFSNVSEQNIRVMEKCIANQLKWDLNAVTTSEFIEELASRLSELVTPELLDKIIDHAHTISNVCLLCCSFVTVPPSVLASACLCVAVSYLASNQLGTCVVLLSRLTGLEQDVLLQHQKNVSDALEMKIQSTCCQEGEESTTPIDIVDLESTEFSFDFQSS